MMLEIIRKIHFVHSPVFASREWILCDNAQADQMEHILHEKKGGTTFACSNEGLIFSGKVGGLDVVHSTAL